MIAVMGASGNVGGKVAHLLLSQQLNVRVFGRSARRLESLALRGAEVVVGDAVNVGELQTLFTEVDAALVVLPADVTDSHFVANRAQMMRAITRALGDQHVGHIVMLSSIGADRDRGVGPIIGLHELEVLLFGLESVNVLALRAAWHMENLLLNLPMIREQRINGGAIKGDHRFPMIAAADIAQKAADHLARRNFSGHTVETILGPRDMSMNEATRALGAALGIPDLPYVEFPADGMRAALQGRGMSEEVASLMVESHIAINEDRVMDEVERTPESTTPTTLDEFLRGVPNLLIA